MIGDLLNITEMTKQIANAAVGENQTPTTAGKIVEFASANQLII